MKNFQFDFDENTYQIRFIFPDKWNGMYRRYTMAILYKKVANPENDKDFIWEEVDWSEAKCKIDIQLLENGKPYNFGDKFDKYVGRKVAFTKLVNENFNREFRKKLWEQFFDTFGIQIKISNPLVLVSL